MREFAASLRTQASDSCYIDETYNLASVGTKTLVRNSTTQLQINSCDATSVFTAGRRVRIVGSTTDYGFVTTSSFSSPNTLVNVTMDESDVPTSPTRVYVHTDTRIAAAAYYPTGSGNGLDADTVDGYHAASILGPAIHADALVNGSMLVWQRGTTGSCPAATRTYHADRWFTNPTGAAVTVDRTTTVPTGAISKYAKKITGATSVTSVDIAGQRIESYLMPYIKTTMTFSILVKNETGGSLNVTMILSTPSVADDFTSSTARLTQVIGSVTSGASSRLSYSVDISGYTNIDNGLEVKFTTASGALNAGTKSVTITEIQMDRSSAFSFFRFRSFPDEMSRCQRYYQKTFPYDTAPAQNSGTLAGALHCQMNSQAVTGSARGAVQWTFGQPMRSTPTVTTYNPNAAASSWDEIGGATNLGANVLDAGDSGVFIYTDTNSSDNSRYAIHATADAEL